MVRVSGAGPRKLHRVDLTHPVAILIAKAAPAPPRFGSPNPKTRGARNRPAPAPAPAGSKTHGFQVWTRPVAILGSGLYMSMQPEARWPDTRPFFCPAQARHRAQAGPTRGTRPCLARGRARHGPQFGGRPGAAQ